MDARARVQILASSNFNGEGARRFMRVLDLAVKEGRSTYEEAEGSFPRIEGVYNHDIC